MPKLLKTPPTEVESGDQALKVTAEQAKVLMDFFENLNEKRREVQNMLTTDTDVTTGEVFGESDEDNSNT